MLRAESITFPPTEAGGDSREVEIECTKIYSKLQKELNAKKKKKRESKVNRLGKKKNTFNFPSKRHHAVTESIISCPTSLPCPVSQARKGKGVTHSWEEDAASPGGREGKAAEAGNHLAEEDFTGGWGGRVGDGESKGRVKGILKVKEKRQRRCLRGPKAEKPRAREPTSRRFQPRRTTPHL